MTLVSIKLECADPTNTHPSAMNQQQSQLTQQQLTPQLHPQQQLTPQSHAQQANVQTHVQQPQQPLTQPNVQQSQIQHAQNQQPQIHQPRNQQPQLQQTRTHNPQIQIQIQQPQTLKLQTQPLLSQQTLINQSQPQSLQPHTTTLNPMHTTNAIPNAASQPHHTMKTEPRQLIHSNNNTSSQPPQLKPNPAYTSIPSHTNASTIAAARAAALSNTPQNHLHMQHLQQQQPQSTIMNNTTNPNTMMKGSKKRSTKRGSGPTVTMATTNNPTNSSNTSGNSNGGTTTSTGGENTGRWTADEHRLFLQGLEQHGKGWKKIASLIKSRTVVQIRTHAQKYFQKLAKARQNGEEGDVSMEGRGNGVGGSIVGGLGMGQLGGVGGGMGNGSGASGSSCGMGYHGSKRRRQTTGTKRKAISSVVSSIQREAKRMQISDPQKSGLAGGTGDRPFPAIAPVLAPFIYQPDGTLSSAPAPAPGVSVQGVQDMNGQVTIPSITTAQGTISGSALEDSLFRFLTPMTGVGDVTPPQIPTQQLNDVARQAGAHPITLPSNKNGNTTINSFSQSQLGGGDVSPTGVADIGSHPNWVWGNETPEWYSKGADVDELLNEADALDWLADSGDLNETYEPATVTITAPTSSSEEEDEHHRQAVAAAVVAEVQGQSYEQDLMNNKDTSGAIGFNSCSVHLPPSLPFLTKPVAPLLEHVPRSVVSNMNVPGLVVTHEMNEMTEEVATPLHPSPSILGVNMPPLPSLFESSNSINVLQDIKMKDCIGSAAGAGNLSSASLFVANDPDVFFSENLEEEEFVTALLD